MLAFALRRLLGSAPTLLALVTLSFFLMRAAPGGPFDRERVLSPAVEQAMNAAYHLDEPAWRQYLRYLGGLVRGDLGPSFQYEGHAVSELIAAGAPLSLLLGLAAMSLALLVGGTLGGLAALRPRSALDRLVALVAMSGLALPGYVVAPLAILLFAVTLGWLPAGGWSGSAGELVLPVCTLALPQLAAIARLTRGALAEVLHAPYIRTARARGLPWPRIVLRHALRPALMPVLSHLGPATAALVTGSVVIEQVFGLPGLGRYFVQAALNRDYTLVLGVVLYYGALIVLFNFLVDLAYAALDPRLRRP